MIVLCKLFKAERRLLDEEENIRVCVDNMYAWCNCMWQVRRE